MKVRYFGDPCLRKKASPIEEITDEVRQLAADMIETMLAHDGCGLAAPQVGESVRMFVSIIKGEEEDGTIVYRDPYVIINPEIEHTTQLMSEMEEGCLSLPKLYIPVMRPISIKFRAMDLEGGVIERDVHDFLARHYMHETDHLNGVLTVDYLKGRRRAQVEPALRLIKKRYR